VESHLCAQNAQRWGTRHYSGTGDWMSSEVPKRHLAHLTKPRIRVFDSGLTAPQCERATPGVSSGLVSPSPSAVVAYAPKLIQYERDPESSVLHTEVASITDLGYPASYRDRVSEMEGAHEMSPSVLLPAIRGRPKGQQPPQAPPARTHDHKISVRESVLFWKVYRTSWQNVLSVRVALFPPGSFLQKRFARHSVEIVGRRRGKSFDVGLARTSKNLRSAPHRNGVHVSRSRAARRGDQAAFPEERRSSIQRSATVRPLGSWGGKCGRGQP
jgi:hypothetical protein